MNFANSILTKGSTLNHPNRRLSYIGQVVRATEAYGGFIREQESVLAGDFNSNKIFDQVSRIGNHTQVVESLQQMGIVSAYHRYRHEGQGAESHNTQFMYRHERHGFHLDYCFVPETWMTRIKSLQVIRALSPPMASYVAIILPIM
jgi:endonuclease/exonuclease/phosphatase family metal-dependent hydrolase